ncbi:MAG TPA: RNA polymerase factor sigma-54 [Micropepsaceae bacterium]|nr:RNA polymerase factor sigma-54 [Micropepsaceae bacterium]
MVISQRMELRQGQTLVMTPQLQQAIKLLQMSNLELQAYVETELEKNPLLEREEGYDASPEAPSRDADASPAPASGVEALDVTMRQGGMDAPETFDTGLENVYADEARADLANRKAADAPADASGGPIDWSRAKNGAQLGEDGEGLEGTLTRALSLRDHLLHEMPVLMTDPAERLIASHLIDEVDEAGYMRAELTDIAARLSASVAAVESVLLRLQRLEPAGIMARSLAECLALQLKEKNRFDPAMEALIAHLDLLAKRDLMGLMKVCGVDSADLADMIAEIKELNPKPGLAFESAPIEAVVPDIFVRNDGHGGFIVDLNSDTLPRVLVNQRYHAEISGKATSREAKTWLSECMLSANWLVKSLDQRARTILKVASEIVRQQDSFFVHGVQHLRPLNLKHIAEAIGMHESTVSRVTSNKYMATPRGLFELKYFFTSAIAASDGGDAHSAESVRHKIRELIAAERPKEILSDDRIVEILKETGIDIARRTVAKYREALRIPSSVERRRSRAMEA